MRQSPQRAAGRYLDNADFSSLGHCAFTAYARVNATVAVSYTALIGCFECFFIGRVECECRGEVRCLKSREVEMRLNVQQIFFALCDQYSVALDIEYDG